MKKTLKDNGGDNKRTHEVEYQHFGEQEKEEWKEIASFASRAVMYPAGNDNVHIYQELLRDELHDQLLWPLVCISEKKKKYTMSFSLCISIIHPTLCKSGPNESNSQILPLAHLDLAGQGACKFCVGVHGGSLGLLRWLMETEGKVTRGGKKGEAE